MKKNKEPILIKGYICSIMYHIHLGDMQWGQGKHCLLPLILSFC